MSYIQRDQCDKCDSIGYTDMVSVVICKTETYASTV